MGKDLDLELDLTTDTARRKDPACIVSIASGDLVIVYGKTYATYDMSLYQDTGRLKFELRNKTEYIDDAIMHVTICNNDIQKMKDILRQVRNQYDRIIYGDILSFNLKDNLISNLHNYWKKISVLEERNNLMAILMRSIENISINDIRDDQIELLDNILDAVSKDYIEENQTEELFNEMLNHGLDPIGSLEGLSEIYDD